MLTECLCSFCTEIDIPTLKYLARHADRPQLVFFTAIMPATVQLGLLLDLLGFLAGACRFYSLLMFI